MSVTITNVLSDVSSTAFSDTSYAASADQLTPLCIPSSVLQELRERYATEFKQLLTCFSSENVQPNLESMSSDRRFRHISWQQSSLHSMTVAFYLLHARYLQALAEAVVADDKLSSRIRFMTSQWVAAMSPSNFFHTNPEAQSQLLATFGESMRAGLSNFFSDLAKGRVSQTDEAAFELGKNLATTPGSVVFENQLFQLLQYRPSAETVYEKPLLIVPPCINKYYVLDLQANNSFVRYAVDQGYNVFMISWRNPDVSMMQMTWDDYVEHGVIEAISAVKEITAQPKINLLGFCIGGTLATTALAVLAERGQQVAASLTLLTALLDFSQTGMLGALVDEAQVTWRESTLAGLHGGHYGLLRGIELANVFSSLRPNELLWCYVVDNYLKGKTPPSFDLLYWNSDSTNLPGPMYAWYLRHLYLDNDLRHPGKLKVCGANVDISTISAPVFVYGSREDYIVPWESAYASVHLLPGPCHFVLGASGHVAGVVNPPSSGKRSYWMNVSDKNSLPLESERWLSAAEERPGSWWVEWQKWLSRHSGEHVLAKKHLGSEFYPPLADAPGDYVKQRTIL